MLVAWIDIILMKYLQSISCDHSFADLVQLAQLAVTYFSTDICVAFQLRFFIHCRINHCRIAQSTLV